jgi:ABC-type dipeptide/oligopeptide/nickel transport system permease component
MLQYVIKKLAIAIPQLFLVSIAVFALIRITPSDPVNLILPSSATEETRALVRHKLHLDEPIIVQYGYFLGGAIRGDFGRSYALQREVSELAGERLMNTLKLGGAALIISYILAIPIGVIAAVRHRTLADHLSVALAYAGQSVPSFLVGLFLILIFAYRLRLLPSSGYMSPMHLILPATALAFEGLAISVRTMRTSMLEVLGSDFIRTLRAKGLPERLVIWRHALKNSLVPVISVFAMRLGWLLGGAVAIEVVFAWPGAGRLLVNAVIEQDYPLTQALTLILAAGVIFANILADVLYSVVNPRIRY